MEENKLISTSQAADQKRCSRKAVVDAIKRGAIPGQQMGRYFVVIADERFEAWLPDRVRQEIGRESQRSENAQARWRDKKGAGNRNGQD